jgi:hypothetical protein
MSWLFSQALVEEFSGGTSLDGEPSSQLNVMPTQHKFWRLDKTIEHSDLSRFGLTLRLLTDTHGAELLTSFLAASRARTSALQAPAPGLTEREAGYGPTWQGSFARYDHEASMWRTAQCSLLGGLDEFSETWPRWGSMRNGASFQRPIPALNMSESASGLWPTPTASNGGSNNNSAAVLHRGHGTNLIGAVKKWPTPCARDYRSPNSKPFSDRGGGKKGEQLVNAVRFYPTPTAGSKKSAGTMQEWGGSKNWVREADPDLARGLLNPTWVEWLMGWPIGWTALEPLETGKFHEWRQQHSICCADSGSISTP